MQRFVLTQNIRRYRELLCSLNDPAERALVERLLAEASDELAGLDRLAAASRAGAREPSARDGERRR
ncbi:hypothetical protein C5708_03080 [Caulobacter sp. CCUG 60055]|uniref:hypothetical protein n=1 Tax=Caulobacter sp. CCUG 60055 TaxID=2100090 RepID=UPI001FA7C395|nr:hypothetical protein [Caulobacter sp. CCUG 60055]MCI3179229.1 hypothetical protein [Caulobacter sp. CCUG 60055]